MNVWTYFLHGGPEGEPRVIPEQPDTPGHLLSIERRTQTGTCDLYVLTSRSDVFMTCAYRWHCGGTPEEVMEAAAELAREATQR